METAWEDRAQPVLLACPRVPPSLHWIFENILEIFETIFVLELNILWS